MSNQEQVSKWLPIETAPKDGTKIIAFMRMSRDVSITFYDAGEWVSWREGPIVEPIAWMPLPAAHPPIDATGNPC